MGDRNRAIEFTALIAKEFSPKRFKKVADVAGGSGMVSQLLTVLGCQLLTPKGASL